MGGRQKHRSPRQLRKSRPSQRKRRSRKKAPEPLRPEELETLEQLRPTLLPVIQSVIAAHPKEVERYRSGQTGILGFLVGQVMKQAAQGGVKPNPKLVNVLVTGELGS